MRARGSAVLPPREEMTVLGVGVVVTDGVRTGGSMTGASKGRIGGRVCDRRPSLEMIGGSVRV